MVINLSSRDINYYKQNAHKPAADLKSSEARAGSSSGSIKATAAERGHDNLAGRQISWVATWVPFSAENEVLAHREMANGFIAKDLL